MYFNDFTTITCKIRICSSTTSVVKEIWINFFSIYSVLRSKNLQDAQKHYSTNTPYRHYVENKCLCNTRAQSLNPLSKRKKRKIVLTKQHYLTTILSPDLITYRLTYKWKDAVHYITWCTASHHGKYERKSY